MIRLGLRLTLDGGREAAVRLAITVLAVAIGVAMLFVALAGMNAINAQNKRTAWLNTGVGGQAVHRPSGPTTASTGGPLWWLLAQDHFGSKTIYRIDVASVGGDTPKLPGVSQVPGPGQYVASPALSHLLATVPADQLGDRFAGRQVGTISTSALPSSNSLVIVIGQQASQLSRNPEAAEVPGVNTDPQIDGPVGLNSNRLQTILAIAALALLFPVLVFISTATRLAAARREQRFAALRLVGATPRQVAVVSAVESTVAAGAGAVLGLGLFFLARPGIAQWAITGEPFERGDLSLGAAAILIVLVGVPIAAAIAARFALRRVRISPLGVMRRAPGGPPRAWRLIPLIAGLGELFYFARVGRPNSVSSQIEVFFLGCLLVMIGLAWSGPWLLIRGSAVLARVATRPAGLIAGRRIADSPRNAFRAISGVVIALFAMSTALGIITTLLAHQGGPDSSSLGGRTLVAQLSPNSILSNAQLAPRNLAIAPAGLAAHLRATKGVTGVALAYQLAPNDSQLVVPCREMAATPGVGALRPGITLALVEPIRGTGLNTNNHSWMAKEVWPAAPVSAAGLSHLLLNSVVVTTNGSAAALERARTALAVSLPTASPAMTLNELSAQQFKTILQIEQMVDVVVISSLVIGGCSLAVSVTSGLNDRKRPFSLLRLTGTPLSILRRVIALEAAVPMVLVAVLSSALGLVVADLFLRAQLSESLSAPNAGYYALLGSGLLAALAILACTLPLVGRITGPEVARNE